jgi:filamin
MRINDLQKDLKDGVLLINLLEIISSKSVGRYNKHPKVPTQKYENTAIAMDFIKKEGIKVVNIGNTDITDGNLRIILGLIWTLILRYQVNRSGDGGKDELLRWVQSKIPEYNITGFKKDWNDGRAVCALTNAIAPGSFPGHRNLDPSRSRDNCAAGINAAHDHLDIPKILEPEALANPRVDEQSVVTYISYFRNAENEGRGRESAAERLAKQCRAYGPGLVEGVSGEAAPFTVDTPNGTTNLEVIVEGPRSRAPVTITKTTKPNGTASYACSYNPTEPGNYKVHVKFGGVHVPGSIFHVTVLAAVSLGGEGKIRVFYSTTASNEKARHDVISLQRLLEAKKVHLRPDFEPWIAVDIMEREDREAVFRKAGTRALPIVYVDDKYIGDFDTLNHLEEIGKLNDILNYKV